MFAKRLIYGLMLVSVVACEDDSEPYRALDIAPESKIIADVPASGGTFTVAINSSSAWSPVYKSGWIDVTATPNELVLTLDDNLECDTRRGIVVIGNADNLTDTIAVEQEAIPFSPDHKYTVPVVFHVIYWREADTIQNVRVGHLQKVLDRVNDLYDNCGVDMGVNFVMAKYDPQGNSLEEPGVNRLKRTRCQIDPSEFLKSGKEEYKNMMWNPNNYLNVVLFTFSSREVLGISQFPWVPEPYDLEGASKVLRGASVSENPYPQCVCINNAYVYDMPEPGVVYSMSNIAVTLSHEIGHFLGLYHAFNQRTNGNTDTNEDTDYCEDTPPYNKSRYDNQLYSFLMDNEINSYNDDYETYVMRRNSKTGETFRSTNIMDYAVSDADKFTPQQAERVRYILHHALFVPGPKDYEGTDINWGNKAGVPFTFTPNCIE